MTALVNDSRFMNAQLRNVVLPNAILFQAMWWSCILDLMILALVLLVLLWSHLLWVIGAQASQRPHSSSSSSSNWRAWARAGFKLIVCLLAFAVIGLLSDGLWFLLSGYQSVSFSDGQVQQPVWLLVLWLGFVTTLPTSMVSLMKHAWLWVGLMAVFGPLAYWVGAQYERLHLADWVIWYVPVQWALLAWLFRFGFVRSGLLGLESHKQHARS